MMWLVKLALEKRYTFIVMAILILIMGVVTISRMSTDIFPEINVPVVSVIWNYSGMSPEDMEKRIVLVSERAYTTTVNDIEHIESQSMRGISIIKIFFHPNSNVESAIAQITATSQSVTRGMPPGITPPSIIRYNASSVPILQLSLNSKSLSEEQLFDYGQNFIRTQLATIQGASVPLPLGGKSRQIMVDLNLQALQSKGLSANDVVSAINAQNLILPTGTAKIGSREYDVALNSSPGIADQINNFPVKQVNGATIFVKDVAQVHDGFAVQTNIVREDGIHGALLTVLKSQGASTLDIISKIKAALPKVASIVPPELKITPLFDQSIFVKASINDVLRSGIIAACLTATMILLFLGSLRSTFIITLSIPLAILTSIVCLFLCGQTLNVMTLGGLGLAIGILVDDATVEIENIHRNINLNESLKTIILNAAQQVATPALVSTLSICIVFFPVILITGAARSLFIPMAMAVVFAMLASYILSRTLVPIMALLLIKPADKLSDSENEENIESKKSYFQRIHSKFNAQFNKLRGLYKHDLGWILNHRKFIVGFFTCFLIVSSMLFPFIGEDFFPTVDAGQIRLHVRAPHGSRIEETEHRFTQVEDVIRQVIPDKERNIILDKIGLPYSGINLAFSDNATIGTGDGEILINLKKDHKTSTQVYIKRLRKSLNEQFPDMSFFFQSADIVSQILNFGHAAPIDVQVSGRKVKPNYKLTQKIMAEIKKVPGAVDVHIHQITDLPQLKLNIDRVKASQMGLTQKDIAGNLLTSLSSSFQVAPNFWIDPKNGVNYSINAQTPQYQINSVETLRSIPVTSGGAIEQINNLAQVSLSKTLAVVNHYNTQPVYDIYVNVQGRDLGGVARDVDKILAKYQKHLPRGTSLDMRGQVESMFSSFSSLGFGLILAIVLVYLLMVINFQSWIDPLIIMIPTPAVLSGILWMLFATRTTFNVPSLMGSIMAIGVATANSILLVSFANEEMGYGHTAKDAAYSAGITRLRPVIMTALAMILGMLPMALGLGEGGEQNAPLGRAVIGGLSVATFATLFLVPTVYSVLNRNKKISINYTERTKYGIQY